nr:hypothetical protein BaRGS_010843 [Batillaria attramentaria]
MPARAATTSPKGRQSEEASEISPREEARTGQVEFPHASASRLQGKAGDVGEYVMDLTPLGGVQIEVDIIVPGNEAMMTIRSKKSALG